MSAPLLKWAGGKRQLIGELMNLVPDDFGNYYEPFLGGGALFFALKDRMKIGKAILSDTNSDLTNLYNLVKKNPEVLWEKINTLEYGNKKEDFYSARSLFNRLNEEEIELRGALLIYLNRHCYNGLFRVNSRGEFNVPFGKYENPVMPDKKKILDVSTAFTETEILVGDFEEVLKGVSKNDFVYLDPPYFPISQSSNFTDYSIGGFSYKQQERLSEIFRKLHKKGAKLMLSNSAVPEIVELYGEFTLHFVGARRNINSKSSGRGRIEEIVVTNY